MLLEHHTLDNGRGGWALWRIEETEEQLHALCPSHVEPCTFGSQARRLEYYAVRAMLAAVIGPDVRMAYRPSRSPYLIDNPTHISISHTKGYAALLWHDTCPIGIDIEQRSERVLRVVSKFVNIREQAQIEAMPPAAALPCAQLIWGAKEAVYKVADAPSLNLQYDVTIGIPAHLGDEGCCAIRCAALSSPYAAHYAFRDDFVLVMALPEG